MQRSRRVAFSLAFGAAAACGQFGAADETEGTAPADGGTSDALDVTATADASSTSDAEVPVGDAGTCDGGSDCERRIFVSSAAYVGSSLGGLAGADAKCQALADEAGGALAGRRWAAWLSDGASAAGARLTHGTRAYRLSNGAVVANDWAQLVSASLEQSIDVDERGGPVPGASVWTGTYADGGSAFASCASWTGGDAGVLGATSYANGGWTNAGSGDCALALRIYCIER